MADMLNPIHQVDFLKSILLSLETLTRDPQVLSILFTIILNL